jgi:hypothetical protein
MKPEDVKLSEILFEFHQVGKVVRVTAIDPRTGIEAIMVGAPKYGKATLKKLATRKLRYVIAKRYTEMGR